MERPIHGPGADGRRGGAIPGRSDPIRILLVDDQPLFRRAIAARDRAEEALEQTTSARIALDRIAEELTGALALMVRYFLRAERTPGRSAMAG